MDIFRQFAADPVKEVEGVWETLGTSPEGKAARLLIARSGNKRHSKVVTQLYESNRSTLELKNEAADAKGEEITVDSMAKGVLLGWEGLEFDGDKLPDSATMTPEDRLVAARKLLGVKDFRALVQKKAEDFAKYKAYQDEAAAGN